MRTARRTTQAGAFSLVETAIAMGILSIVLVALLNMIGMAAKNRSLLADTIDAQMLAQDLMDEILLMHYEEPDEVVRFGLEASESGLDRSRFDDIDDYDGWNADRTETPQGHDGTARPWPAGWARSVTVDYADPASLDMAGSASDGVKRITVLVTKHDRELASLTMIMTDAWEHSAHD